MPAAKVREALFPASVVAQASFTESLQIEDVVRCYGRHVTALGMSLLGRADEVEDLAQDVFVQAYRQLNRIRTPFALKSWLTVVTVRMAYRRLRARRFWAYVDLFASEEALDVASHEASPETRALLGRVYRTLDRLKPSHRVAWVLHHMEGETLPRVAELCGCSLATAKRRIASAQAEVERDVGHE